MLTGVYASILTDDVDDASVKSPFVDAAAMLPLFDCMVTSPLFTLFKSTLLAAVNDTFTCADDARNAD